MLPLFDARPDESMARSRCFLTWDGEFGVLESAPSADPHRWAVEEYEASNRLNGACYYAAKFRCVRCGETLHEEWPEYPSDPLKILPKTVVNWDGSPPVGAWEES